MRLISGRMAVILIVATAVVAAAAAPAQTLAAQGRSPGSGLSARWVGQDGHDYVSPNNGLEPSEVQDMHVVLGGLDPEHEISYVDVKTEQGDEWEYNVQSFSWKAELKRTRGLALPTSSSSPGMWKHLAIIISKSGTTTERPGRPSSAAARSAAACGCRARPSRPGGWVRKSRIMSSAGPSPGPDGIADVRIRLSAVSTRIPVRAMRVEGPGGLKWESGANPDLLPAAEYWADPKKPGEGDLFFQPERDLKGVKLKVLVLYNNDILDQAVVTAGRVDPRLRIPDSPLPRISELAATGRWLGQDGQDVTGSGDVHVQLSGLDADAVDRRGRADRLGARIVGLSRQRSHQHDCSSRGYHGPAGGPARVGPRLARPLLRALPRRDRRRRSRSGSSTWKAGWPWPGLTAARATLPGALPGRPRRESTPNRATTSTPWRTSTAR